MKMAQTSPTKSTFKRSKWLIAHCSLLLAIGAPTWAQQDVTPAVPSAVNIGAAVIPGIMDALLQQHKTPQQLWDDGRLTADILPDVLNEQPLGRTENQQAAHQLCALLVEKLPEALDDPLALPPRTRLRLAQYFKNIKDARAVTFYEAILSLIKTPREAGVREVFELSDYYSETGDWEMAAETRLRMKDYTTAEPYLANAAGEAARMYAQHMQIDKAMALYDRTAKSDYGWAVGITYLDQGRLLMRRRKYDEAIKILLQPVKGLYADQITVALLSTAAQCYYQTGDLTNALEYSEQAVKQYDSIKSPLKNEGLEQHYITAKNTIKMVGVWHQKTFIAEPDSIKLSRSSSDGVTIRIRQYRDSSITVTTSSPFITARLIYIPWSNEVEGNFDTVKEVYCEMKRDPPEDMADAAVIIRSAENPNSEMRIPVGFIQ